MSDRKNIKIAAELFNDLKDDKGEHKSWPQYLRDECLSDDTDTVTLDDATINRIGEQVANEVQE